MTPTPIRVFVASHVGPASDAKQARDGEVVCFGVAGVGRHGLLYGLETAGPASLFRVEELPGGLPALMAAIRAHLDASGYSSLFPAAVEQTVEQYARELARVAGSFAVGTLVRKRGTAFAAADAPVLAGVR